jgi:AraC-like DNA-binding protein
VAGYAAFGSGDGRAVAHRLLPLNFPVLIVDFTEGRTLLTGPRVRASADGMTTWGSGVSIGLTPLGAMMVSGCPLSEIFGQIISLDLSWAPRLAALPSWADRFAWLDSAFSVPTGAGPARGGRAGAGAAWDDGAFAGAAWGGGAFAEAAWGGGALAGAAWGSGVGAGVSGRGGAGARASGRGGAFAGSRWASVNAAWWRLQRGARVASVAAALGSTRRGLERDFRREFGISPGAVARIARLQRSLTALLGGASPAAAAAAGDFADQPHLTRTMRDAVGLTPATFRRLVQDVSPPMSGRSSES